MYPWPMPATLGKKCHNAPPQMLGIDKVLRRESSVKVFMYFNFQKVFRWSLDSQIVLKKCHIGTFELLRTWNLTSFLELLWKCLQGWHKV